MSRSKDSVERVYLLSSNSDRMATRESRVPIQIESHQSPRVCDFSRTKGWWILRGQKQPPEFLISFLLFLIKFPRISVYVYLCAFYDSSWNCEWMDLPFVPGFATVPNSGLMIYLSCDLSAGIRLCLLCRMGLLFSMTCVVFALVLFGFERRRRTNWSDLIFCPCGTGEGSGSGHQGMFLKP